MITYKWTFSAFECKVNEDGMQNVITTVHWRYDGTNEDGVSAEIYGAQEVEAPTPEAFIPYPELSEEQVIEWMESAINMEKMKAKIDSNINAIVNPVNVTLQAPWDVNEQ